MSLINVTKLINVNTVALALYKSFNFLCCGCSIQLNTLPKYSTVNTSNRMLRKMEVENINFAVADEVNVSCAEESIDEERARGIVLKHSLTSLIQLISCNFSLVGSGFPVFST